MAALFTAQLAGAAWELPDIFAYRTQDLAVLRKGFAQPPREAAPWVYWFWWNSVVSREAVLFHLTQMFGRLDAKLRHFYGRTLWDVASDSWEYERHRGGERYWSPAILDAFPQLAGYDLRDKMHALLGYDPERERVLHDLEKVERQLVRDNYHRPSGLLGPVLLVPDRRITLADGRKTSPPPAKMPAAGSAG